MVCFWNGLVLEWFALEWSVIAEAIAMELLIVCTLPQNFTPLYLTKSFSKVGRRAQMICVGHTTVYEMETQTGILGIGHVQILTALVSQKFTFSSASPNFRLNSSRLSAPLG